MVLVDGNKRQMQFGTVEVGVDPLIVREGTEEDMRQIGGARLESIEGRAKFGDALFGGQWLMVERAAGDSWGCGGRRAWLCK
jgi:hypothetical protein